MQKLMVSSVLPFHFSNNCSLKKIWKELKKRMTNIFNGNKALWWFIDQFYWKQCNASFLFSLESHNFPLKYK